MSPFFFITHFIPLSKTFWWWRSCFWQNTNKQSRETGTTAAAEKAWWRWLWYGGGCEPVKSFLGFMFFSSSFPIRLFTPCKFVNRIWRKEGNGKPFSVEDEGKADREGWRKLDKKKWEQRRRLERWRVGIGFEGILCLMNFLNKDDFGIVEDEDCCCFYFYFYFLFFLK